MFSLTRSTILPGLELAHWPGDDIVQEEDQCEYKERRKKRAQKVVDYVSDADFVPGLALSVCTTNPRWTFARKINRKVDEPSPRRNIGILDALRTIIEDYRNIISGNDIAANFVINRLPSSTSTRMLVFSTIMRGLLYLAEKNRPFCTETWGFLRGEGNVSDLLKDLDDKQFCMETGSTFKMAQVLRHLEKGSVGRMMEESSIRFCLENLASEIRKAGGIDTTEVERLLSTLRALGAKMPYQLEVCAVYFIYFMFLIGFRRFVIYTCCSRAQQVGR